MANKLPGPVSSPLYSRLYLERGKVIGDSLRFRRRLSTQFVSLSGDSLADQDAFGTHAVKELGADIPRVAGSFLPHKAFLEGELRDVLDMITLFYRWLVRLRWIEEHANSSRAFQGTFRSIDPLRWRDFVARAMREENVAYCIDEECVVHYYVDEEFERSKSATLAVLSDQRFANAKSCYESAYRHMDGPPPDTKAAVRSLFEAAEVLAKQLCPGAQNLNKKLVEVALKDKCSPLLATDATELKTLQGFFESFGLWVNAVHMYRHGQDAPEPVAPSEATAVYVLSSGSAFIRLLADCYLRSQNGAPAA